MYIFLESCLILKVKEDLSELKSMLSIEKEKRKFERLQSLYLKKKNPNIT